MSSLKDTFEANTWEAKTFQSGNWRGSSAFVPHVAAKCEAVFAVPLSETALGIPLTALSVQSITLQARIKGFTLEPEETFARTLQAEKVVGDGC